MSKEVIAYLDDAVINQSEDALSVFVEENRRTSKYVDRLARLDLSGARGNGEIPIRVRVRLRVRLRVRVRVRVRVR